MANDNDLVWAMMADLDFCMLVTRAGARMRSRPMSSIVKPEEGKIYFLTDAATAKDDEIAADPHILLVYGDGKATFISTSAIATLHDDRALVRRLWNPGAQAFWPQGPDDPSIIAIAATPAEAQYWEGPNLVLRSVRFAVALATGSTADFGDEGRVRLNATNSGPD